MSRQWAGYWLLVGGLAIAAALLLAAEVAGAHPAVGRVAATGGRARCYGSGTLIHKDGSSGIVVVLALIDAVVDVVSAVRPESPPPTPPSGAAALPAIGKEADPDTL